MLARHGQHWTRAEDAVLYDAAAVNRRVGYFKGQGGRGGALRPAAERLGRSYTAVLIRASRIWARSQKNTGRAEYRPATRRWRGINRPYKEKAHAPTWALGRERGQGA